MKKLLLAFTCLCALPSLKAQNTDLPGPASNLQTIAAGSLVIAMDNTLQVNSSGDFNLKAYGLIVYLLNNNVRIKWCIKAGKLKDGIDFTGIAEQVKPTLILGGSSKNFKAGPFIINVSDTTGVSRLIDAFYTANSLTGLNRPQVYRLTADAVDVDIRYDLTAFRPKAAVLTDGGNQNIHLAYMTAAAIPTESYATSAGTDLISDCFTFASEPHNTNTGTAVNNAITAIKDFVNKGGNFLAQCEAIANYENNSLGRFQTTTGITVVNTNIGTSLTYANPDLSFCQFEGAYNASLGGSIKNWKIITSATNYEHDHATGTGTYSSSIGASVSKHYNGKGGLVFYLGNHSFTTSSLAAINGLRMYMNAFLTPSNTNCPSLLFTVLPLRLLHFTGNYESNKTVLSWSVEGNELVDHFLIERSLDGRNFSSCGSIAATINVGTASYQFTDHQLNPRILYRLKVIDKQSKVQYSNILSFNSRITGTDGLAILNNAPTSEFVIKYKATKSSPIFVNVYNSFGVSIFSTKLICIEGDNLITVPYSNMMERSIYYIEVVNDRRERFTSKLVRL